MSLSDKEIRSNILEAPVYPRLDVNMSSIFPKCPKCKKEMVPISVDNSTIQGDDYCLTFARWMCVDNKCGYYVGLKK